MIVSFEPEIFCTLATRFRAVFAGNPSRLVFKSLTTYTCKLQRLLLYLKLPVNCPITFSGVCAGPCNALEGLSVWYQLENEK